MTQHFLHFFGGTARLRQLNRQIDFSAPIFFFHKVAKQRFGFFLFKLATFFFFFKSEFQRFY